MDSLVIDRVSATGTIGGVYPAPDVFECLRSEQQTAMHLLLSRVVGIRKGRPLIYCLRHVTAAYGSDVRWRVTDNLVRERPRHAEVNRLWIVADNSDGLLPLDVIDDFIPRAAWEPLWRFVADGPAMAFRTTDALLACWANGLDLDGTTRRPQSVASVKQFLTARRRFARLILDTLSASSLIGVNLPEEFHQWSLVPLPPDKDPATDFYAVHANRDKPAPPLIVVRRALSDLTRRNNRVKKRRSGSRQLVQRQRILIGILVLGPRAGTVAALRVCDYIPCHTFPDGVRGPALRYTHLKGQPGVSRIQGIPQELAEWIEEYMEYMGMDRRSTVSLWWNSRSPYGENDCQNSAAITSSCQAAMRRYTPPDDPRTYSPHTLRRLCEEKACLYGAAWIQEHEEELAHLVDGLPIDPQCWANFLLDHEAAGSMSVLYKGLKNTSAHEKWGRLAALGVWEYVRGDRGARKGPDVEAIEAARETLVDREVDVRLIESQVQGLQARETAVREEKTLVFSRPCHETEALIRALFDLQRLDHGLDVLRGEMDVAREEMVEAEVALERARRDLVDAERSRVPLDDFLSTEEVSDLRAMAEKQQDSDEEGGIAILRRTFTLKEFAWAIGMSESQVRRFVLKNSAWRAFFDDDSGGPYPRGVERPSRNKARFAFDELPLGRYPTEAIQRLRWLMSQPEGCGLPGLTRVT